MARTQKHHIPAAGVVGKCSVPMWSIGPAGFCDREAYGEQYSEREPSRGCSGKHAPPQWALRDRNGYYLPGGVHPPMASGLCCDAHGGPGPNDIRFMRDGDMWCAFMPGFINLAESIAGFGRTQDEAEIDLTAAFLKADIVND